MGALMRYRANPVIKLFDGRTRSMFKNNVASLGDPASGARF